MMSVNLAELEAETYLTQMSLAGRVSVACVNSPTNVTLSGDEFAIDQLETGLKKGGVFARKLRTGVAYHSSAMHQVAAAYLSSLGRLEPRELDGGNPVMVSSVTSQKVATTSLLDPQYWVDNLESPVRFADALQYVVHTAPKVDGLKSITNYLEIGPHGALHRPVRDTLAHAGNSTARYGSVLSKQDSPSKTILQLVGQLFTYGHRVSITAANQQDGPSTAAKPVADSPEYPFDRTQTYWYEPRVARDWRLREGPSQSLLGLRTSDWNPLRPRWRKMLKVEEVPWSADHVVGNTIVFPAVGSITMAMEAVKQTVGGSQPIRGYLVKEATFTSPIIVTPGQTTEIMTHLRPLQQTYERSSTRFEVEIFACAENYWRACNKHIIHVEFEPETQTEVDGGRELQILTGSLARKYGSIKSKADVTINSSDFYRWLHENGFQYGPTFSLADEICWDGDELATAQVNVGPPVESFKEGVVHPGVLDSCLQLCTIPPSKGMSTHFPTCIPHKIQDAWIAETGWQNPSTSRIKVLTEAKVKHAAAGLDCEVAVLSETGALLCFIKLLEMSPVMARELGDNDGGKTLMRRIDWNPHIPLQRTHGLSHTGRQSSDDEDATTHDRIGLEETLRSVAQQKINSLRDIDRKKMPARTKKYISWIERQLREKPMRDVPEATDLTTRLQDLGMRRPWSKMFIEVAQSLPSTIQGEPHELKLSLSSALFQDCLDDAMAALCNQDLEAHLGLLAHQKPTQRILEIGARRGVLTSYALSVFQNIEARTGGIAFSEYTCSDGSTASLDDARQRFAEHQHRMDFMSLDVNRDLTTQGLQPASFDVIIAAGALRGAQDTGAVLQNLRRVLTPGGQLILHEITASGRFEIGFGFGITADWWSDQPEDRYSDQMLTTSQWDAVLKDNGFSGTDLVIRDSQEDAAHCFSLMTSREATQPSLPRADTRVLMLIDDNDDFQKSLAESVLQSTSWSSRVLTLDKMADEKLESGDYVICLTDVHQPFLHPMTQATLNTVRNWVQQSTNLFWVTAYDVESTGFSSSYPYAGIKDGLLRTLRSEFALNHIVSLTIGDSTRDVATCARYVSSVFESAFVSGLSDDDEYIVQDGQILTGRLVDDIDINKDLMAFTVPEIITEPWLPGPPLTLAIGIRGQLETLQFREDLAYYDELGPTDVEIEAKVWGVGFRDVFLALGRLDEDDFGADCAGIVTRVGAEVQSVKVGNRVCMQTNDGMKTYIRAHEWTTAKIADSVSFEEACAVVIPGMTALQSFMEIARLQKGEKVLIHSASGGTGQVALQIAQMVGAEIFATVGFDHKKQLLIDEYGVPADHIFYSRDTSFARGVMRATNGYGVDVALNSLTGESLRATWECMAPYGRMVEIGKAEINANASLPMGSFKWNVLYAGVDLHHIAKDMKKKDLAHALLQKTMDLAKDGIIRAPKPLHVYDVDKVEDAFRYLASGRNAGRIVIRVDRSTNVQVCDKPLDGTSRLVAWQLTRQQKPLIKRRTWTFDENATYLVAGGLGGIGRSMLKWMATRGAKYLLVPSRSGAASAAAAEVVRELSDQNVVVSTPRCDLSSKDSLSRILAESATTLPPIRGCIIATMVLNVSNKVSRGPI